MANFVVEYGLPVVPQFDLAHLWLYCVCQSGYPGQHYSPPARLVPAGRIKTSLSEYCIQQ